MASVPISAFRTAAQQDLATSSLGDSRCQTGRAFVRRRPTPAQGRSLELLGHAIEYLIDSDLNEAHSASCAPVSEASQLLMRLSREVFAECQEIVPFWERVRRRASRLVQPQDSEVREVPTLGSADLIR
jgi:hypothetical protein